MLSSDAHKAYSTEPSWAEHVNVKSESELRVERGKGRWWAHILGRDTIRFHAWLLSSNPVCHSELSESIWCVCWCPLWWMRLNMCFIIDFHHQFLQPWLRQSGLVSTVNFKDMSRLNAVQNTVLCSYSQLMMEVSCSGPCRSVGTDRYNFLASCWLSRLMFGS